MRVNRLGLAWVFAAICLWPHTGEAQTLSKAVNFNGPALTIDGKLFQTEASVGATTNGQRFSNQTVALSPSANAALAEMIRSSVYSRSLSVNIPVVNGSYQVYVYNWEDNATGTFSMTIEGVTVLTGQSTGPAGSWRKLGPFNASVKDGSLTLGATGTVAVNVSGVEIYSSSATPTPTPTPPPSPTPVPPASSSASHRSMKEIVLSAAPGTLNPYFGVTFNVYFKRPNGTEVKVDGFFDGNSLFKARAYADTVGTWTWRSTSNLAALNGKSGSFSVVSSSLPGKLRAHRSDSRQFQYDNGQWFLHIGDTGYRYVVDTEPLWQKYIDQAAQMGATKVRTWFARGRYDVAALFANGRASLNLAYWQEIDKRIAYAAAKYPNLQLQLIPFAEDSAELERYLNGDAASKMVARYAQARYSAYANVQWCISNDRSMGVTALRSAVGQIGTDMSAREPWGTLITNHQIRRSGYAFPTASWSDIVTLEDIDQVHGARILEYRGKSSTPVVNDEDRYESYIAPTDPRYFFRRLMWGSLLSGGAATYGGLQSWEAYDGASGIKGVRPYFDAVAAGKLKGGAADFRHIHKFFAESGFNLAGMTPNDSLVGSRPYQVKAMSSGSTRYLFYLANPSGSTPQTDTMSTTTPSVTINLSTTRGYQSSWFNPRTGEWTNGSAIGGGTQTLRAPGAGDWILVLK